MAFTTIDNPELYLQAKTYSGNGSTNAITFDGSENMQPDWLWLKCRNVANGSNIFDVLRGTNSLHSDTTGPEADRASDGFTSLDSDGFTLNGSGSGGSINVSGRTYVGWGWKAGGSASSNSNGSVTTSVSANTTAGFSVVNVPTTGSVLTAGHGLSQAPEMIFEKSRDRTDNWIVYNSSIGNTKAIFLNLNNATSTATDFWNDTSPTSTVWTMGSENSVNNAGQETIAYCFHSVKGYSKIGSYTGNGNADGSFVYTGFRPAYFLVKNTAASEHWRIYDNKRDTFNHMYHVLFANEASAESTVDNASEEIDFVSNGIKIRSSAQQLNGSGQTLIYMAFAESPFVNSSGVPNNGR